MAPDRHAHHLSRMRDVLPLPSAIERLNDHAPPGREATVRNEALRQIWRRLRTEPKARSSIPPDRPRRRLR